jgi:hypothetical protein
MASEPIEAAQVSTPAQSAAPVHSKNKKRYSGNAKAVQQFERRVSKSTHRISRAVEKGIQTYLDRRDESVGRLRDGAILESYVNIASGLSEGIAEASPTITDLAKAVNSKRTRRLLRSVVRTIPAPFWR